jgi:hypothetical protein
MSLTRTLLTTAVLGAAVLVPSTAQAAEGFTGVTTDGRVVRFQSDSLPGLSPAPVEVTGLASGERVVGLDRAPTGELIALTSAGNVDALDAATGKATAKFSAPVTGPIEPSGALTFAVAPDGRTARIITANRDEVVDLATGAAKAAGGLHFAPGDHHAGAQAAPAFDYASDGRLIGIDSARRSADRGRLVDGEHARRAPVQGARASAGDRRLRRRGVGRDAPLQRPQPPAAVALRALRPGAGQAHRRQRSVPRRRARRGRRRRRGRR